MELPTLRYLLEQGVEQGLHIGAQAYVSRSGEPVADLAVGEAAPGVAMTPDTVNLWLSSTKPITVIAFAQWWERGEMRLDEPVDRLIPEFGVHGKEAITWRHVLTHTGGFRRARFKHPDDDWDAIIQAICDAKIEPNWTPGEKAGYHVHTGWFILGEAVRRLSGQPFAAYVKEHLLEPLEMHDSWVGMTPQAYQVYRESDRLGVMMDTSGDAPAPAGMHREAWVTHARPGGNGYGPARELAMFYEMLLHGGRAGLDPIVEPDTVRLFTARQRAGMYDHTFNHNMDWSLGFICNSAHYGSATTPYGYGPHASEDTFGHSGYQSSVGFADPLHRLAVAIVCNGMPGEVKHHQRTRALLKSIYEDLGLAEQPFEAAM